MMYRTVIVIGSYTHYDLIYMFNSGRWFSVNGATMWETDDLHEVDQRLVRTRKGNWFLPKSQEEISEGQAIAWLVKNDREIPHDLRKAFEDLEV